MQGKLIPKDKVENKVNYDNNHTLALTWPQV